MSVRRALFSVLFLLGALTPGLAAPAVTPGQFQALPLERSAQNHLVVRAFINGKPARLGVDTGAPFSAIAASRKQYFGIVSLPGASTLPARVLVNGAFSSVGIAKTFRLGGLSLMDEPIVAINLGRPGRNGSARAQEIDGILGADILFPTRAVIDCQQQILILNTEPQNEAATPGLDYTGFNSVPMHVTEGYNLYVDGKVNGTPAQLMVDTGAFATILHQPFVKRMKIPMRDTPFRSAAVNLRQRNVQVANIKRLTVGSVDIVGRNVGVIDLGDLLSRDLISGDRPIAGLLGSELLQRHHGIIDFGTRRLYLKR